VKNLTLDEQIQAAVKAERARVVSVCLAEYKRWKNVDDATRQMDDICIGALGASSNILAHVLELVKESKPSAT
jgi:hypothetical protein